MSEEYERKDDCLLYETVADAAATDAAAGIDIVVEVESHCGNAMLMKKRSPVPQPPLPPPDRGTIVCRPLHSDNSPRQTAYSTTSLYHLRCSDSISTCQSRYY